MSYNPHPLDKHLGGKVRYRRTMKSMSQSTLGEKLNLTFQQIQKYEKGVNRISCSTLYEISNILETPVNYFFEEYENNNNQLKEENSKFISEISDSELLTLVKAYSKINDSHVRKQVVSLLKSLSVNQN